MPSVGHKDALVKGFGSLRGGRRRSGEGIRGQGGHAFGRGGPRVWAEAAVALAEAVAAAVVGVVEAGGQQDRRTCQPVAVAGELVQPDNLVISNNQVR